MAPGYFASTTLMNTAPFHFSPCLSPNWTAKAHAIRSTLRLLMTAAVLSLSTISSAYAAAAGIMDEAEFFSKSAKEEASKLIESAAKEFKKDLCIESLKELPKEIKGAVNPQNKAAADRMYEQFTIKQATKRKVNGVYILLVREPAHMHVVVGNETLRRVFTLKDKDALVDMMLGHLRKKEFDDALLKGTRFVTATMKSNTLPGITSSDSWPAVGRGSLAEMKFGWVGTALIALVAVMLISRLIGGLFAGGSPGMGGYPSSGGGFFSSLMGGLFGAAAGMWIYDHLFGHQGGQSAYGADASNGSADLGAEDTDYSGSGGDFNGDHSESHQSGGDFGGADDFGGGGDSGGGDFGGDF
jgi:uncharacterized protein